MTSFSLKGIVRRASEAETKDVSLAPNRYWSDAKGKLEREKRLFSASTCYLVFCSEADPRASIRIPFQASIPLPGLDECANLTGTATLSCPMTGVHKLLQTWIKEQSGGAEAALERDLLEAFKASAAAARATVFDDPSRYRVGGDLNPRVQDDIRRSWGLDVVLEMPLPALGRFGRSELSVEASVRLIDYQQPFVVTAMMEISGEPTSALRAVAMAGREATLKERLRDDIQDYYSKQVTLAGLYDDNDRKRRVDGLQAVLTERVSLYGRMSKLVEPNEARPAPPGEPTETIHFELPPFALAGEPQPVTVELTLRLEQVKLAVLMKKIDALSAKSFRAAFLPLAQAKLKSETSVWTGAKLKSSNRDDLKETLTKAYQSLLLEFGYEQRFIDLKTSLDGAAASKEGAFDFDAHVYTAATPDVRVKIGVKVFLQFHPGSYDLPKHKIREKYDSRIHLALQSILAKRTPSAIYIGWEQPFAGCEPLKDEIRQAIKMIFADDVEHLDLTLDLQEGRELLERRSTILSQTIERENVSLNPDGVPGDVLADVYARVVSIEEEAWERMSSRRDHAGSWDPVNEAQEDFHRILGREFSKIVDERSSVPFSRAAVIERLGTNLTAEISKVHHINIYPHVTLHAASNLIAYWQQQVERERMEVDSYGKNEREILLAMEEKRSDLVKELKTGGNQLDINQHKAALTNLGAALQETREKSAGFNTTFSKANYYLQLLSVPPHLTAGPKGDPLKADEPSPENQP